MQGISTIILAGGAGRRVGGRDKGLIEWQGRPLISHVLDRMRAQSDQIVISANRNQSVYESMGFTVISDAHADYPGPLAGIFSASKACRHDILMIVPCDCPDVPSDLVQKLLRQIDDFDIVVPVDELHLQVLFMLVRKTATASIPAYLNNGSRSVMGWIASHKWSEVDYRGYEDAFRNMNYLKDEKPSDHAN